MVKPDSGKREHTGDACSSLCELEMVHVLVATAKGGGDSDLHATCENGCLPVLCCHRALLPYARRCPPARPDPPHPLLPWLEDDRGCTLILL